MIKKENTPQLNTPFHSFGLQNPGQMLAKLEREFSRLSRDTFDPNEVRDHTINCAMTAWLMIDWVWELHFRGNDAALNELAARAGVKRKKGKEKKRYILEIIEY